MFARESPHTIPSDETGRNEVPNAPPESRQGEGGPGEGGDAAAVLDDGDVSETIEEMMASLDIQLSDDDSDGERGQE